MEQVNFFKGDLPHILLSPFLNMFTHFTWGISSKISLEINKFRKNKINLEIRLRLLWGTVNEGNLKKSLQLWLQKLKVSSLGPYLMMILIIT